MDHFFWGEADTLYTEKWLWNVAWVAASGRVFNVPPWQSTSLFSRLGLDHNGPLTGLFGFPELLQDKLGFSKGYGDK